MKKFFGTLIQFVGLIMITVTSAALTDINNEKKNLLSQARTELDQDYRYSLESSQASAIFAGFFGLIIFIIGLIMLLTKSNKQKKLEAEINILKHGKENSPKAETITELESLFELKQNGVLTDEEFIAAKRKILT
jgi:hypothetical protein